MTGTVYKSTGSWYKVKTKEGDFLDCRIKGKWRIKEIKSTNPIAVGDVVDYDVETNGDEIIGVIRNLHFRENYLVRKSVNLSKRTHIIASNINQILLVITLKNPNTSTIFIDRFLVTSEAFRIPAILVFNKTDIYDEKELSNISNLKAMYQSLGYKCIQTSIKNPESIVNLKNQMKGKTSVFSGHSGVGKSTLVNSVEPSLNLKVKQISNYHQQGQHTTTFSEMFDMSFGARIIDSPGIRGLGIISIDREELQNYFVDFFRVHQNCKYYNCKHLDEPHCAVKNALKKEEIALSRYKSYLQILEEDSDNPYR